jgi:hypothetical protein
MSKFTEELLRILFIVPQRRLTFRELLFGVRGLVFSTRVMGILTLFVSRLGEIFGNFKRINLYSYENFSRIRNVVEETTKKFPEFGYSEITVEHFETGSGDVDLIAVDVVENGRKFRIEIACGRRISAQKAGKRESSWNGLAFT